MTLLYYYINLINYKGIIGDKYFFADSGYDNK